MIRYEEYIRFFCMKWKALIHICLELNLKSETAGTLLCSSRATTALLRPRLSLPMIVPTIIKTKQ